MSDVTKTQENEVETKHQAPRLNERILSSLSRRTVAAHPWHDLEIGIFAEDDRICHLYLICIQE
jgi:inorganic pyrophosphatase